jgi:putative endonuclease
MTRRNCHTDIIDYDNRFPHSQPEPAIRLASLAHGYSREANALSDQRESKGPSMRYTVYILRFTNNQLYIGQTNNLEQRLVDHKNKADRASKFSKDNGDFELVYTEAYQTQLESMRREKQLKGWTRAKKEALISNNLVLLKKL